MKPAWTITGILAVLLIGIILAPSPSQATKDLAQEEGLQCTSCHYKPGSVLLTDRGKFYETMGTLDGYDEIASSFKRCTYCHLAKPGSQRLTRKGKQFAEFFDDMDGLREWLQQRHPQPTREEIEDRGSSE